LAGFGRLLLRLIFILAVIEKLGDRRYRIRGDLHEIKPGLLGSLQSDLNIDGPVIVPGLIDQLDFAGADLLIDARAVLGGGLRGSHRSANGFALLMLLQRTWLVSRFRSSDH